KHSYLGLVCTLILALGIPGFAADYYINDLSDSNDVYCSALGDDSNPGTDPSLPKLTLTNLLATIDLEPGDMVYIDSGYYTNSVVEITTNDQGSAGSYVTLQGSTNDWGKGTFFVGTNTSSHILFYLNGVNSVRLRNLVLTNAHRGIYCQATMNCVVEHVRITSCNRGLMTAGSLNNLDLRSCVFAFTSGALYLAGSGTGANIDNCVIYSNSYAIFYGNSASISNSIIVGNNPFSASFPSRADFNILWTTNIGFGYDSLASVQKDIGTWTRSTTADPQFVDPGTLDFHLKSVLGRFNPATGLWQTDTVHSVAIDFGNPVNSAANEPEPNGSRLNVGLHGNTWQASKSRTNLWLFALSYNDGGSLSAPADSVYWTGNLTNGETVRIELSGDAGETWAIAQTGLLASAGTWGWANTNLESSKVARWRVVYEGDTNVLDMCNANFVFKTKEFRYYVNDSSTNGDVYCSAPGQTNNTGTTAAEPQASLKAVLDAYDLEPGDIIFVDTGIYNLNATPIIVSANGGDSNAYVYIRGSTNGTVFVRNNQAGNAYALHLNDADYVDISNIEFRR
ncbi:MAG TPA: hypothetical protein PKU89_11220, partial [Kiritimatiellia bacterium]|nr:hypothetical protein [Kiritimatiellia bacterium]